MAATSKKLLFVDTNIWLDFYRVQGGAGLRLLKNVEAIKDKVIVTYQIESEFKANRQRVLINSLTNLKAPSGIGLPNIVADAKRTKMLSKDISNAQRRVSGLQKHLARVISKLTAHDPVYKACQRIFHRADDPIVLTRENQQKVEIRRRALQRFMHGCPPRKNNDITIGDAFNWEWMVYCAIGQKAELVIVTRDTDYGVIHEGHSYLNDHLRQEFQERVSKRRKIVLCSLLTEALKHFKVKVTKKDSQAEEKLVSTGIEATVVAAGDRRRREIHRALEAMGGEEESETGHRRPMSERLLKFLTAPEARDKGGAV